MQLSIPKGRGRSGREQILREFPSFLCCIRSLHCWALRAVRRSFPILSLMTPLLLVTASLSRLVQVKCDIWACH